MRRPDSKDGLVSLIDISSRSPSHFTPPEVVTKRYAARLLARSNDTPTMAQVLIIYKQKQNTMCYCKSQWQLPHYEVRPSPEVHAP